MPTVVGHALVGWAAAQNAAPRLAKAQLKLLGLVAALLAMLPDVDVLGFAFGIPYGSKLGHRGFSHSLLVAALVALAGAAAAPALRAGVARAFVFLFVAIASHGALDAFTNGGLGVAFLWPWSGERFFAPEALRVIEVSPIGPARFLSARGAVVLGSEVRWIWLPALAVGLMLIAARRGWSGRRRGGHA